MVLSNAETNTGVDDVSSYLQTEGLAVDAKCCGSKERKEIAVDPKLFDKYVGRYQLAPNFILAVTREGDHLFAQATGQPKFELFG